jgi:hypothetical protein
VLGKPRRWLVPLGVATLLVAGATPATAAVVDPGPIGPNQFFTAQVNGVSGQSRIAVVCDGGTDLLPTGHPVAGQIVRVVPAVLPPTGPLPLAGFTGSAGKAVTVGLGASDVPKPFAVLRFYQAGASIPTDLVVPCTGTGVVTFVPTPMSDTARASAVKVTFVTQPSPTQL